LDGERIQLDEGVVTQTTKQLLQAFTKNETKYNPIPSHIIISTNTIENKHPEENSYKSDFSLFATEPRYSLDEIYLPDKTRKQIMTALTIQKHNDKLRNQWGLGSILKDGRAVIMNFFVLQVRAKV
jgi:hypothetical protein